MLKKLLEPRIWGRIYRERAGEPLLYNLASICVALFGSIVQKIDYDLVPRQPYAFGMLRAFQAAHRDRDRLAIKRLVFVEFGVASGAGLINMGRVADRLSRHFGIPYLVIGFDTGEGMPPPVDYRDHPEFYLDGDFKPAPDFTGALPEHVELVIGSIRHTVGKLADRLSEGDIVGFVSIDVDYWSSTKDCYRLFDNPEVRKLPMTPMYLDDIGYLEHHPFAGERLATAEFNDEHERMKITPMQNLRNHRLFKGAPWLDQMYWFVDLDSPYFERAMHAGRDRVTLGNVYLQAA